MAKKKVPISLPKVDDLFSSQSEREDAAAGRVAEIPASLINTFPDHPFKVRDDEDMAQLVESIGESGILVPLVVRSKSDGRYELISGHRRLHAAESLGIEAVPCLVRELSDEESVIAMVDSNLQRETILPSERAFAYSMRLEAMKRQGRRTDLTCEHSAHKSDGRRSRDILAEELGVSKDKIRRYIRLTFLVPDLLEMVDAGRMKMLPAIEASYLTTSEQVVLFDAMCAEACTPSHAQAIKMRRFSEDGKLSRDVIQSILQEEKPNQVEHFRIPKKNLSRYFKPNAKPEDVESRIIKALEPLEQAERRQSLSGDGGAL